MQNIFAEFSVTSNSSAQDIPHNLNERVIYFIDEVNIFPARLFALHDRFALATVFYFLLH